MSDKVAHAGSKKVAQNFLNSGSPTASLDFGGRSSGEVASKSCVGGSSDGKERSH